jgi:uncharacterized membrane protein
MRIASWGHAAFAATMIALGILGLVQGDFAAILQPVPKGLPAREALVYLCAIVSLAAGVGLFFRRTAAVAARVLVAWLLLWLLLLRLPGLFRSLSVDIWWAACKTGVMLAGAWVLYVWFASGWDKRFSFATGERGLTIARDLYGIALIPFGLAHFLYLQNTASLVPRWLGWPVGWSYFTGAAFVAAGVAIVSGRFAHLAAKLSALEMGLFTLLIWVPVVASGHYNAFQWSEFVVSGALTAAGWVVTDSWRSR